MNKSELVSLASFLLLGVAGISCSEPLPQYQDPRDVFVGSLGAAYSISPLENSLKAYFTVRNSYDETFEAEGTLTGRIVLVWADDPSLRRTFTLTPDNVVFARSYDRTTGILRLDPGDSIRFAVSWNFFADDGRSLLSVAGFKVDPTCRNRHISEKLIPIVIEGNAQLYQRTGTITASSVVFRFELHRNYVAPRDCAP